MRTYKRKNSYKKQLKKSGITELKNICLELRNNYTIYNKEIWVIMDKKREYIACSASQRRCLCKLPEIKSKRILTYSSEKTAQSQLGKNGFCGYFSLKRKDLEAVKCQMLLSEIEVKKEKNEKVEE